MSHNLLDHVRTGWTQKKKPILLVGGLVVTVVFVVAAGTFAYTKAYEGKIYPNVWIDSMNVGGMTQEEAYQLVDGRLQDMLDDGLIVEIDGQTLTIDLRASGADDPDLITDRIYVEVDDAIERAFEIGRGDKPIIDALGALSYLIGGSETIEPYVTILEGDLEATIRELLQERELDTLEEPGKPTHYAYGEQGELTIVEGTEGSTFDFDGLFDELETAVGDFDLNPIELVVVEQTVDVSKQDADQHLSSVSSMIEHAPYSLTYTNQYQRTYDWDVTDEDLLEWIVPAWTDRDLLELELTGDAFDTFMEDIHETVDVEPTDARFQIEGNRVSEFAASQNGVTVDDEATIEALMWVLEHADAVTEIGPEPVEVVTMETEAEVTTDSVNNLGINEILGVGVSDFSGSPYNRVQNIIHGAGKLNGILLAPGETLSLVEELGPFTVADGYLPELVIKGDEIKPEVGGGLCQIGTTTFRATMNAGLEVTERRNHSLVVNYYNDPSNGNPGTDATIYDPAPDYKMTNDTENYVLLTTEVDLDTYHLYFTFWGTSDGREGYYTAPEILSWTGYGETQYIETTDLAPGVEQCQSPHSGATTSFTYYVDYADGESHEKTYTSTYRSLPWICLVGVETLSCDPEAEDCEAVEETSDDESTDDESTEEASDDTADEVEETADEPEVDEGEETTEE